MSVSEEIIKAAEKYGTPVYIYDAAGIRETARAIKSAFASVPGYKNYFAVKATPTPAILKILQEEDMGFDCSTASELEIMKRMGISGHDIFYTSNNTPKEDFEMAIGLGAIVNIDDITQVPVFLAALGDRKYNTVALRYNPGAAKSGNVIIGDPVEAKYGMRADQLVGAVSLLKESGVERFSLHTMVASNELESDYFAETARILSGVAKEVEKETGVKFSLLNLGGGFGVDYSHGKSGVNLEAIAKAYKSASEELGGIQVVTENGRFVTGPHGYLVTTVRYVMSKYKEYIGVDASMHNLMRPGMYGAYHKISVVGKDREDGKLKKFDVVGSLCENNDKFAIDRELPGDIAVGDILVIHDVGAHGHAMGFNYNGLLKSAEILLQADGSTRLIRRAETVDDYLSMVVFGGEL